MKTIIAGSRSVRDFRIIAEAMSDFCKQFGVVTEVVTGCAKGADELGQLWAEKQSTPIKRFPADWLTFGKAAGPIRNSQMADYADALVAVWDGQSRGTANMIEQARKRGLKIHIHMVSARLSSQIGKMQI